MNPKELTDEEMDVLIAPTSEELTDEQMDARIPPPETSKLEQFKEATIEGLPGLGAMAGGITAGIPGAFVGGYGGKAIQNLIRPPKEKADYILDPIEAGAESSLFEKGGQLVGKGIGKGFNLAKSGVKKALTTLGPYEEAINARLAGKAQDIAPSYEELAHKLSNEANQLYSQAKEGSQVAKGKLGKRPTVNRDHALSSIENAIESFKYNGKVTSESADISIKKLKTILDNFKNLPEELSEQDLKHIVEVLDDQGELWKDQIPKKLTETLRQLRHGYDQLIKMNQDYRKEMVPVAIKTRIANRLRKKFGLITEPGESNPLSERLKPSNTTADAVKNSVNKKKIENRTILDRLQKVTGSNFPEMANDYRLAQQFQKPTTQGSRKTVLVGGIGSAVGKLLGHTEAGVAAGVVQGALADRYGGRVVASLIDNYLKVGNSAAFGPFKKLIEDAARRGPEALGVVSAALSQNPEFKKIVGLEE